MSARAFGCRSVGLAALLLGACAGRSEHHDDESPVGKGGSDGLGTGGAAAAAGASVGGGGAGGSSSAGGSGTGGTFTLGNAAGKSSEGLPTCLLPPDPGPCRGAQARFAFDPATLACVPFTYGGCQGNDNRFETEAACRTACIDTLPAECGPTARPDGCPCTEREQCAGGCESGAFAQTRKCEPVTAGYCRSCCAEGESACWVDGEHVSGV